MNRIRKILSDIQGIFSNQKEENWKIIALCLLGATIFWFFNALNKEYTTRIRYPISFQFPQDSTVILGELPQEVQLIVTGGGWNLLRKTFWFDINPVEIELDNPTETKYISASSLRTALSDNIGEISLIEILSDTLKLDIEKLVTKKVPLQVDSARIPLSNNYRIVSPIYTSADSVLLKGPESMVKNLSDTFSISLFNNKIDRDFEEEVKLAPYVPKLVNVMPEQVTISFEVARYVKVDKEVYVQLRNMPSLAYFLQDSTVTLSFMIPENDISKLKSNEFEVVADFNRINWQDTTIVAEVVEFPDYVVNVSPDTVSVQVGFNKNRKPI
ncbi:MAG: hypothetical protein ACNS62_01050 [Candidatus Cyclobacteriaceae bacterium M3_2C_046]